MKSRYITILGSFFIFLFVVGIVAASNPNDDIYFHAIHADDPDKLENLYLSIGLNTPVDPALGAFQSVNHIFTWVDGTAAFESVDVETAITTHPPSAAVSDPDRPAPEYGEVRSSLDFSVISGGDINNAEYCVEVVFENSTLALGCMDITSHIISPQSPPVPFWP